MNIQPKITPVLDPGFVPAVLWNQAFEAKAAADPASHQVDIALTRNDGTCFRWSGKLLPHTGEKRLRTRMHMPKMLSLQHGP